MTEEEKRVLDGMLKLKLHETLIEGNLVIRRVPGGWIYRTPGGAVFVPLTTKI